MSSTECILCDRRGDATYHGLPDSVHQGMHDSCWALRYGLDPEQYIRESLDGPASHVPIVAERVP